MTFRAKSVLWGLALLYCGPVSINACCVNITIAVLTERSALVDFPSQLNRTIGIIERAMNKTREILQHVANVEFIIKNMDFPGCTDSHWGALLAELYHVDQINAIVGPGCTNSVQLASRMASSWKIPLMTFGGTGESSGDKKQFTTLSRLSYTMNTFAKFYVAVFNAFSWVDIANIYDTSSVSTAMVGYSLHSSFMRDGINSNLMPFNSKEGDLETELLRLLNEAKKVSRVFLVSCHGDIFRKMVLLAQHVGMRQGEYTFIFFHVLKGDPVLGDYTWKKGDSLDPEAKRAYQSVMVISPRRPVTEEFLEFETEVKKRATEVYGYVWPKKAELNVFNIAHYDCFMLYAYALNDTLTAGEDPRDGASVIKQMWNRTFPGIGGMVYINENGDRDADFTLLDEEPVTGEWRVVGQYLGYTHTFELFSDLLHFPNGDGPHANRPPCGFVGELCISYSLPTYASVAIAFSVVILIVVVVGGFIYRRMKAEAEIHSQWWKIKWEDISVQAAKASFGSSCSSFRESKSQSVATRTVAFRTLGIYKGTQVHIQKPIIKTLTVDRKLLLELKQMRDITCQNLTRLIGVCPEPSNVCILTEFCSRGNLQDILQNESIQLDWDFRISLITDIVQGMHYIHSSPIEVHGRLTSSRCVIDSRFVLKITGFGLKSIAESALRHKNKTNLNNYYNVLDEIWDLIESVSEGFLTYSSKHMVGLTPPLQQDLSETESYAVVPEMLWMAPEILRKYPLRTTTHAGDVYSFAIILYEMCTRNEPYVTEAWYQSLEDTVEKIKREDKTPTRPAFSETGSFSDLMKLTVLCWQEKPEDRPSFTAIRKTVQSLRRDNHGKNILDTLLHRMEQYANNLEGLVEERTRAFLEEKKKSEELLYQVLPKSVADQLRSGQAVIPEAFSCVTIYFSDIVGFTSISAASTPLQVVDFLNDVYTCFDGIIENYEVYKVETIGDAYMVVSGLPVRNENEHVRQIAQMSLSILEQVQRFTIRHQPETPLQARIGLHSGPVCAGVVGRKMPRYCLFGDAVNTASRMESNGEAMKIHISASTKTLLDMFGSFIMEERGTINVKGKGLMSTYWLIREVSEV